MARERIATGMSISDIMDMSISKFESYTPKQQREITSRLASAANKRLRNLEKSGIENPTTIRLNLSGGKISVKGKSGDELKQEFFRAKQFLGSKLSSKKEWKKFEKAITENYQGNESRYTMGLAFSYFDVLQEIDPKISALREKYRLVDQIADYIQAGDNAETIINKSKEYLEKRYNQEQERYNNQNVSFGDRLDNSRKRYRRKKRNR